MAVYEDRKKKKKNLPRESRDVLEHREMVGAKLTGSGGIAFPNGPA